MPCNGHPNADCFGKHCGNWYIEGGVHHCTTAEASFKASKAHDTAVDTVTSEVREIIRLTKSYIGVCERARQARREWLQSEVNLLKTRVARLMALKELKRLYQARRRQLIMQHPYGFMSDLGYHFSDRALDGMAKATEQQTEFNSYTELVDYYDHEGTRNSLLANPAKLAALRLAAAE
jgi:hypothetical protein